MGITKTRLKLPPWKLASIETYSTNFFEAEQWTGKLLKGTKDKVTFAGDNQRYTRQIPSDFINRKNYPVLWHMGSWAQQFGHYSEGLEGDHQAYFYAYEPRNFFGRTGSIIRIPNSIVIEYLVIGNYESTKVVSHSPTKQVLDIQGSDSYFDNKNIFIGDVFYTYNSPGKCMPVSVYLGHEDKYLYGNCLAIAEINGGFFHLPWDVFVLNVELVRRYYNRFQNWRLIIHQTSYDIDISNDGYTSYYAEQLGPNCRLMPTGTRANPDQILSYARDFYGV